MCSLVIEMKLIMVTYSNFDNIMLQEFMFSLTVFLFIHVALSLNGFRVNDGDRTIIVKYAEDQQKKKERKVPNGYDAPSPMKTVYEMEDQYYYHQDNMPRGGHPNAPPYGVHNMGGPGYFYAGNEVQNGRRNYYNKNNNHPNGGLPSTNRQPVDNWYPSVPPPHGYDNRPSNFNNVPAHYPPGVSMHHNPVMKSQPGTGGEQVQVGGSVTLVITNLPSHADVATLHDLISPYGRILSAQIDVLESSPTQPAAANQLCSGRGQVQMANINQAQYAIQALSGTILSEAGQPLQMFLYSK